MISVQIPSFIQILHTPGFIKLKGPKGTFIKKVGDLRFNRLKNSQGAFLFVSGTTKQEESTALFQIQQLCLGIVRGFRRRLRLSGVGFRATRREGSLSTSRFGGGKHIFTKKYRQKRSVNAASTSQRQVRLKIGYSHECYFPIVASNELNVQTSRLEGRSKGRLISIQGQDLCLVNKLASELRSFRKPNVYKGKGILYDKEIIHLKKGKRQA